MQFLLSNQQRIGRGSLDPVRACLLINALIELKRFWSASANSKLKAEGNPLSLTTCSSTVRLAADADSCSLASAVNDMMDSWVSRVEPAKSGAKEWY